MAAWGTKTFEEDIANDWLQELIDTSDPHEFILDSLVVDVEYLEAEQASAVLAASETLIALLDEPRVGIPSELVDWVGNNECEDVSDLLEMAIGAVDKVLSDGSELKEIWSDSDAFDEWQHNVESMKEVLVSLSVM